MIFYVNTNVGDILVNKMCTSNIIHPVLKTLLYKIEMRNLLKENTDGLIYDKQ